MSRQKSKSSKVKKSKEKEDMLTRFINSWPIMYMPYVFKYNPLWVKEDWRVIVAREQKKRKDKGLISRIISFAP